jgi:antitoxin (DNA-binding transcriptional repressor) of toxin-antitoxin stability system
LVGVKSVGIFEAKTKFTSLCEEVLRTGRAIVVSKRGQPMVQVAPLPVGDQGERPDVLTAWQQWTDDHGEESAEFPDVWELRGKAKRNPLHE